MTREEMLGEVYASHYPLFRFLAARIVGHQDCKDVIQTAFLKVLKCRRRLEEPDDAKRYVARAVIHAAFDSARKRAREPTSEASEVLEVFPFCLAGSDPLSLLLGAEEIHEQELLICRILPVADRLCRQTQVPLGLICNQQRGALTAYSNQLGLPISTLRSRQIAVLRQLRAFAC